MRLKKNILKCLLTLVLFLFMAAPSWGAQTPNNTNSQKPVITYAALINNGTQIDINGNHLHQNEVTQVILGRNNASTIGIDLDLTVSSSTVDGKQVIVNLPTGVLDGTHLLTVITSKGSDEYSFTIGAVGPEGPAGADGADGAPGTNGTNGVDGAWANLLAFSDVATPYNPIASRVAVNGTVEKWTRASTNGTFTTAVFAMGLRRRQTADVDAA